MCLRVRPILLWLFTCSLGIHTRSTYVRIATTPGSDWAAFAEEASREINVDNRFAGRTLAREIRFLDAEFAEVCDGNAAFKSTRTPNSSPNLWR